MCWYFRCFTDNFSKITSNNYLSKFHHCSNCRGSPIWKGGQEQLTQRNVFQFLYSSFQISLNGDSVLVSSLLGKRQLNSRPTRHELYARLAPLVDKSTLYIKLSTYQGLSKSCHHVPPGFKLFCNGYHFVLHCLLFTVLHAILPIHGDQQYAYIMAYLIPRPTWLLPLIFPVQAAREGWC